MCPVVTFSLSDQEYCLDVSCVQEVVRIVAITPLPAAPPEILGAINLRGVPVLVLDLRQRFGLPYQPPTLASPLLIVKLSGAAHDVRLAVLVDQVIAVVQDLIAPDAAGLVRIADRLVVMLNPDDLPSAPMLPLLGLDASVLHDQVNRRL
jgi:chemotaxis signal transduction protein